MFQRFTEYLVVLSEHIVYNNQRWKEPKSARTNPTRTQVLPRTEPLEEPNRTWTQMSWFLLSSFTQS